MVYTAAFLFAHGVPLLSEESVVDLSCFIPKDSTTGEKNKMMEGRTTRRGSVESYEDTDNESLCGTFDATLEDEERLLQHGVVRQLELCLTAAKSSTLHCQALLLPRQMTSRMGRDVVRSSVDEPCGLRGASIRVYVETKDGLKSLGAFSPDPSVTPTFELSVVFRIDQSGWPLRHIFDQGKVVKLRPEYRLIKRKLYSSASPVIHDFN
uniref:DNA damage-inducible transcript 4-like protein n=1 Tax=Neogobius melanostomus TaxID=47308 RepID=A0A8C6S911_9GOBI